LLIKSEYLSISGDITVYDALKQIRLLAPDIETVYYAYIVDQEENLRGVVSLKELLINPSGTMIADIMAENLKTVNVESTPENILEIIAKYNLIAVPVLDMEGKMTGIVTVDDILELFLPYALRRRRYHH
jgi:magnesium transporter